MKNDGCAIGIFDSGLGGLTVFKEIRRLLPNESLIYLGDTARVPYGTKSSETIIRYSLQNAGFLSGLGLKAMVVACNTSSAYALPALQEKYDFPIIGVVKPGAAFAAETTKNCKVGVIGTSSTILSNCYANELKSIREKIRVVSIACPLFVPLVEEGWLEDDVTRLIAEKYLSGIRAENADSLILGCTHYPLLKNVIQKVVGESVTLIDSAHSVACALEKELEEKNIKNYSSQNVSYQIYVTDMPGKFEIIAHRFLSGNLPQVKRIEL